MRGHLNARWSPSRHIDLVKPATPYRICQIAIALSLANAATQPEMNSPYIRKTSSIERLDLTALKAPNKHAKKIPSQHNATPPLSGLNDYRCILHAHAED